MAATRECNSVVTAGRLSKAVEFFDAAESLEDDKPNAAGDLFVKAGIAASDVICCVRLGIHSSSKNHTEAANLLEKADKGSEKHLNVLLSSSEPIIPKPDSCSPTPTAGRYTLTPSGSGSTGSLQQRTYRASRFTI